MRNTINVKSELVRQRLVVLAGLCVMLCLSIFHVVSGYSVNHLAGHAWGTDDAFITYRYSRNLMQGYGPVFNPGEKAVEGYSNFLYMLLVAPAFLFIDGIGGYFLAVFLNLIFVAIALVAYYNFVQERLGNASATVAVILFVLCPSIWVGISLGLESVLVLLLQMCIWFAVERISTIDGKQHVAPLLVFVVLIVLTRVDGFLSPLLAIIYLLLRNHKREAVYVSIAAIVTLGLHVAWRYSYYGYLLPNTYYAKVSGSLLERFRSAADQLVLLSQRSGFMPVLGILVLAIGFTIVDMWNSHSKVHEALQEFRFDTFFSLCWIGYWFYIGGDIMNDRLILILYPMSAFLLLRLIINNRWRLAWSWAVIVVVILVQLSPLKMEPRYAYRIPKYDLWQTLGIYLREAHPEATLATSAAGKMPYYSSLTTYDMLGLNDLHIAHLPASSFVISESKIDLDYTLELQPTLIAIGVDGFSSAENAHLNLHYGLTYEKYTNAGYVLRYLAYNWTYPDDEPIVDVQGMDEQIMRDLVEHGYTFAVLERIDQ